MKTPKEKAEELFNKYYIELKEHKGYYDTETAKQCALIAVDELIDSIEICFEDYKSLAKNNYWQEVKTEIENL